MQQRKVSIGGIGFKTCRVSIELKVIRLKLSVLIDISNIGDTWDSKGHDKLIQSQIRLCLFGRSIHVQNELGIIFSRKQPNLTKPNLN